MDKLQHPMKMSKGKAPQFAARVFPTNEDRAVYSAIKKELADNDKAIITPGFLRLDQILGTVNRVDFPVLTNEGTTAQRGSEQRLRPSDAFYVTDVGVQVTKEVILSGAGSSEPLTWANAAVFSGVDQPAIAILMNTGRLRVEVDGVVWLQALDLARFREVGTAQTIAPSTNASAYTRGNSLATVTPVFRLNGGSSNVVSILVGQSIAAAAPVVTDQNVLTVVFRGWLAQNAGQFNPAQRA